jgi:2-polyprenyl-3-methyl-5-hydroxy-6-metoxy-1,4-benzoquinol methylase
MGANNWKQRIYDSYMSNGFQDSHSTKREFDLQSKYFRKNYLKFMPKNKKCRILELGCGMGQFLEFCKQCGYNNYEGIDVSQENISFIKEMFGEEVKVWIADIREFLDAESSRESGYDVVILNDVIEHLTKSEVFEVLDGVYKLLTKNGVFMIKTPNMANPYVNTAGRYIDFTHEIGFTEKSMRQVLRAAGYKEITIIGTDIYVFNPVISIIAKVISKIINCFLFLFSALYGRTSLKIFEKDILAIAYK